MSGIACIFLFNGQPVPPGQLELITSTMHQLGPDGIAHWQRGHVALGHCMLRTTPEAFEETQPLLSEDGQRVLVMDGRLDNIDELRRKLVGKGAVLRTRADAELVLRAYEVWGEACVDHLLGDFALAIWDARRAQLFCARDHLGARPFYYALTRQGLYLASEDEVLARMPGVSSCVDDEKMADHLAPGPDLDPARSWLRDVRQLMPGEAMVVQPDGRLRPWTYWQPEPEPELCFTSDEEYREAFLEVFGLAVKARMRSAAPLAAMVSGGLDTAAIVAMLRRQMAHEPHRQFHAYSAVSDDPQTCIETRCIDELATHPQTIAHRVAVPSMTGMVTQADLQEAAWRRPHPTDNAILLPAMMCLAAQREGHRVMLMGTSGDVTMHVPLRYPAQLLQQGHWKVAWREINGASQNNPYLKGSTPWQQFALNLGLAYAPAGLRRSVRGVLDRLHGAGDAQQLIAPELAQRVHWNARRHADLLREAREAHSGNLKLKVELVFRQPGVTHGLTGFARVAGRHGIELRDPWADRRVVDFFLRLPLRQQIRDGWTKYPVRQAFGRALSPKVTCRSDKAHLGWHFSMRAMEGMRERLRHVTEAQLELLRPHADLERVRQHFQNYGNADHEPQTAPIFQLWTLLQYLQRIQTH